MDVAQALKEVLRRSVLPASVQDDLWQFLQRGDEQDLKNVLRLFTDQPESISIIYQNYFAKKKFLLQRNPSEWQKILQAEYRLLDKKAKPES